MAAISGWAGRVSLGAGSFPAVVLPAVRWTVVTTSELIDVTHVGDGIVALGNNGHYPAAQNTAKSYVAGYADMEVSVDCIWDQSINPISSAGALAALGGKLATGTFAAVDLFLDRSSATARFSLNLVIETITVEQEVRGVCKWSFTAKQSGYFGGVNSPSSIQIPGSSSS